MIHLRYPQGSREWHLARLYTPTASEAEHLITAKRWEITSGAARIKYAHTLITQRALGFPLEGWLSPAMLHGRDWEPKARARYELEHGVEVEECGFCLTDDGTFGASPDAFVGEDGSLEIKCPENPAVHMGAVLNHDGFKDAHWVQVQSQLYVTGRAWTDLVSYFPANLPMVCLRITPHPEFQEKLGAAIKQFVTDLKNLMALAEARGVVFPEPESGVPAMDYQDGLTEEDVETYLASLREKQKS